MLQDYQLAADHPLQIMDIEEDKSDHLQYKKGQLIYCENSTPLGVYFVQEGSVKISKIGCDGKEQILRIVTSNEMMGYVDMVSNSRYTTSAKTLEDTTLLFIPKQEFWSTLKKQRQLFENFVLLLSDDLREAEEKIADLAYKPVRGRLADALIYLFKKFNKENKPKKAISISRFDLACLVGTAKETINRLLSEFRTEKIVTTEGTKINILEIEGLNRLSKMYN